MPTPRTPVFKPKKRLLYETVADATPASKISEGRPNSDELEVAELNRQLALNGREWKELIDRMVGSDYFRSSDNLPKLLYWLWSKFPKRMTDLDIEIEVYQNRQNPSSIDTTRSRVALADLRKKVAAYQLNERGEPWLLKPPKGKGGHRLGFIAADRPSSATHSFWNVHLRSFGDPVLITGSHLFFFDTNTNKIIRYYDFNVKGDPDDEDILTALKEAHPEELGLQGDAVGFQPWRDVYLAKGDVCAHESFLKWFHRESDSKILIERRTSRTITTSEIHRQNAILIGRPQTNPLIETLMRSEPQKSRFAFRIHPLKGGLQVSINKPGDYPELDGLPISPEGLVGPLPIHERVFGILTRFPNPGGRGFVTIISCGHYAMVIARIVDATTNEHHAKELLRQMGRASGEPLPDAFEMVFTVDIAPGGLEGEGFPKLLLWRQR